MPDDHDTPRSNRKDTDPLHDVNFSGPAPHLKQGASSLLSAAIAAAGKVIMSSDTTKK